VFGLWTDEAGFLPGWCFAPEVILKIATQLGPEASRCKGTIVLAGVNLAPPSGGTFQTVWRFYRALNLKGWSTGVLNFSKYGGEHLPEGSCTLPTTHMPVGRAYGWSRHVYGQTVASAIRQADLVIVHGVYVHPLLQVSRMAVKEGIPYILVPHGSLDPFSLSHHRWRKTVWLFLYREMLFARSAAVLYGSEVEKNRSVVSGSERRPECIPWPVDAEFAAPRSSARERVRMRHSLTGDRRIALFCARLARVKRLAETIRAFLRVAPRDWVLLCVGPASTEVDMGEIRSLCARSEGRCIYAGPVFGREVADYYSAADLFVLFSYSENFGHSVGQALAYGVPVALSPGIGLASYVHRYGGGFVSEGDSFDDLCRALEKAFECDSSTLRDLGAAGRMWVERELNPVHFAEKLDRLCQSVCAEAGRGAERIQQVLTP
jgi:glycosyltransferase involved in cell wall biosynthesis